MNPSRSVISRSGLNRKRKREETMEEVKSNIENGILTVQLSGRISSSNAAGIEAEINKLADQSGDDLAVLDCEGLEYISSAGLRVILRLKKSSPSLKIINASSEVYDIFEMTGFTEMMEVKKAYRRLSVDGCKMLGRGSNGEVYRIDDETIIKVYKNSDALPEIQRERELARKAFILGIPTAIPYDVVRVGEGYGSVFELINSKSFSDLIIDKPENIDKYISLSVDLLKKIHSVELKPGEMPDMRETALSWAEFLKEHLPEDIHKKLVSLISDVPASCKMLHGDYHMKNVLMQNGEVILIDMDTLCLGDPIFEFGSIYNGYAGFSELDHSVTESFLGIPWETAQYIWDKTVRMYFDTDDEAKISEIKTKSEIIGQTRIMRRSIKRLSGTEFGKKQIECSRRHLIELVPKTDSLLLFQ